MDCMNQNERLQQPTNQKIAQWLKENFAAIDNRQRPFVTLCYAQGWDGSIAIQAGEPLPLSNDESTRLTHQLRSLHDGILVGVGTVLADNPRLSVREWSGPDPQPIVLDSHLRIPATARLCHLSQKRCWVLSSRQSDPEWDESLEVITLRGDAEGRVCLHTALEVLWQRGIRSLMVEGGANVITAFLREQLADAIVLTVAPTIVGGYKAVGEFASKGHLPGISPLFTARMADDLIMWGQLQYPQATGGSDNE